MSLTIGDLPTVLLVEILGQVGIKALFSVVSCVCREWERQGSALLSSLRALDLSCLPELSAQDEGSGVSDAFRMARALRTVLARTPLLEALVVCTTTGESPQLASIPSSSLPVDEICLPALRSLEMRGGCSNEQLIGVASRCPLLEHLDFFYGSTAGRLSARVWTCDAHVLALLRERLPRLTSLPTMRIAPAWRMNELGVREPSPAHFVTLFDLLREWPGLHEVNLLADGHSPDTWLDVARQFAREPCRFGDVVCVRVEEDLRTLGYLGLRLGVETKISHSGRLVLDWWVGAEEQWDAAVVAGPQRVAGARQRSAVRAIVVEHRASLHTLGTCS